MLLLQILVLLVLLAIFLQDIFSRSVYWVLIPVLTVFFLAMKFLQHQGLMEILQDVPVNLGFLALQVLLVTAYFSFKKGHLVNVTAQLLGWGDILFLCSIAFYLSILNFLLFYVASLVSILSGWLLWQAFSKNKHKQIPLAGLQALLFTVFLAGAWWYSHLDLTNDYWLLQLLMK